MTGTCGLVVATDLARHNRLKSDAAIVTAITTAPASTLDHGNVAAAVGKADFTGHTSHTHIARGAGKALSTKALPCRAAGSVTATGEGIDTRNAALISKQIGSTCGAA